ncbi:MAG: hypothetical protein ACRDHZ_09685 [Ktedonobacteraceae bacterium]
MSNQSEVARIREQIELEIVAMRHAANFATVARHDIISHHYRQLDIHFHKLSAFVGPSQAIGEIATAVEKAAK